jgi:GST-like protein
MAEKYQAIQWMMVQMTGVGPMFGQHVHFSRFAPSGNDYARTRYATQVHKLLDLLDQRLGQSAYLGGTEYGIADIATFPWSRIVETLIGTAQSRYPNVLRWNDKIAARPAVQRALAAVDNVRARTTAWDKAEPDHLDRFLARGKYAIARGFQAPEAPAYCGAGSIICPPPRSTLNSASPRRTSPSGSSANHPLTPV